MTQEMTMAARDRLSLDIGDLRERIEKCKDDDALWREASLSQKIRALLAERLDEIEAEKSKKK